MGLTATAAAISAAVAAIPGDVTTPLADKIMDVAGYTAIIFVAVLIEKYLLTLSGLLLFKILIPAAAILSIVRSFISNDNWRMKFRNIIVKFLLVGLLLWVLVPASLVVSNCIDKTFQNSNNTVIDQSIEEYSKAQENQNTNEDGMTLWERAKNWTSNITDIAKDEISKAKVNAGEQLNTLLERFAAFLVKTCVIPIVVLFVGLWIVRTIGGVPIPDIESKLKKTKGSKLIKKIKTSSDKE